MTDFNNPNAIKKAKIDSCFSNSEISKSDIGYAFSNSNPSMNSLKFSKKGEDFIKLLNDKKSSLQTKLDSCTATMIAAKAILIEHGFTFTSDDNNNDRVNYDYKSCTEDQLKMIYAYGDSCYPCNRLKDEIKTCQVLIDNLDAKKTYDLSTPQLLSLQKALEFDIEKSKDYGTLIQKLYKRQGRNPDGSINSNAEEEWRNESLEKSDDNDLEKGGEGSRGGKIIGHTKSGKPVYENFNHPKHDSFNSKEHGEASDFHRQKIDELKEKREKLSGKALKNETEETRDKINETDKKIEHHFKGRDHHSDIAEKTQHDKKDDVKKALDIIWL